MGTVHRAVQARQHRPHRQSWRGVPDGGAQVARVLREADDAVRAKLGGQPRGQEPVAGLADGVVALGVCGGVVQLRGRHAFRWGEDVDQHAAGPDDADTVERGRGHGGGANEQGGE